MDPTENLEAQLRLAREMLDETTDLDVGDAAFLAELVLGLDGWLRNGGFLPEQWKQREE